jgi:CubicO group peptidase (beta-lactamase class C family)
VVVPGVTGLPQPGDVGAALAAGVKAVTPTSIVKLARHRLLRTTTTPFGPRDKVRRVMLRILGYLGVLAVALAPAAHANPVDEFLDDSWPRGAGGTVIAARDGRIVTCKGLGMANRAARIRARCDTVYDVMSMTKQFTGAAILKLEMMGKLRVTDPIANYIGPVPDDKRAVTLHHLLTHTAGLVEALGDDYEPVTRDAMLDRALESRLRSAPGAEHHYSNLGYSVLAAIVEKASGLPYERFLATHLFKPAGMTQTGYVLPAWKRRRIAIEYDEHGRPKGMPFDHPWAHDGPYWNLRGNGGLLSTARDMFRWHRALEGDAILSEDAKRKLFAPHVPEVAGGDTFYGYGWSIVPGGIAAHDGGNGWSYGVLARFERERALVFWISNRAYAKGRWNLPRRAEELTLAIRRSSKRLTHSG